MTEPAAVPGIPAALGSRRALLVLGMHRSGTSALARVLSLLGGELPRTLMPAQPDNPEGFWESLPISRANERWLRALDRDWSDPRPLPVDWRERLGFAGAVREAGAILEAEFPAASLWIVKDPRLCRLAPVWLEALAGLGVPAAALLCLRDPREVAASLARRNGLGLPSASLGWARYLLDAERHTRGLPRALVHFEALLGDWRGALGKALLPLGLADLPGCPEAAATVDEFLDAGRRGRSVVAILSSEDPLPAPARACYALFRDGLPRSGTACAALDAGVEAAASAAFAGQTVNVPAPPAPLQVPARSLVLIHYHLPETHGAPLDAQLQRCLGEGWQAHEGAAAGWATVNVGRYLERHPRILALSSTTARLPVPVLEGVEVVPLWMLAHPLERVRALHLHDLRHGDPQATAVAAQGLIAWVGWRLANPGDRTLRDAQTQRLAWGLPRAAGDEYTRARRVLEALPWVGLQEHPGTWLPAVEALLRRLLPARQWWLPEPLPLPETPAERLQALAAELGEEFYASLREANARDLALYAAAAARAGLESA